IYCLKYSSTKSSAATEASKNSSLRFKKALLGRAALLLLLLLLSLSYMMMSRSLTWGRKYRRRFVGRNEVQGGRNPDRKVKGGGSLHWNIPKEGRWDGRGSAF